MLKKYFLKIISALIEISFLIIETLYLFHLFYSNIYFLFFPAFILIRMLIKHFMKNLSKKKKIKFIKKK
jgi:hypothetical protein